MSQLSYLISCLVLQMTSTVTLLEFIMEDISKRIFLPFKSGLHFQLDLIKLSQMNFILVYIQKKRISWHGEENLLLIISKWKNEHDFWLLIAFLGGRLNVNLIQTEIKQNRTERVTQPMEILKHSLEAYIKHQGLSNLIQVFFSYFNLN